MVASTRHPIRPLFDLGQLGATPGALGLLAGTFGPDAAAMLTSLLRRHVTGDWGDLDEEDRRDNDAAVRHGTRSRNRIAEISVPACPMPTQKTKVVIYDPQPTGLFKPETPMPILIWYNQHSAPMPVRIKQNINRPRYFFPGMPMVCWMSRSILP